MAGTVDLTVQLSERREKIKRELLADGLVLPERPRYEPPKLLTNITDVDDRRLMRLLVQFTRYQDHIAGQLAEAEIDESSAEQMLEVAKAQAIVDNWTGESASRVTITKANSTLDRDVKRLDSAVREKKARRKLLQILVDGLARDAAVVSRELTRRVSLEPLERRHDRGVA